MTHIDDFPYLPDDRVAPPTKLNVNNFQYLYAVPLKAPAHLPNHGAAHMSVAKKPHVGD